MSEQQTESATINIADIANAINIIDYAASKGAFSGPDLELVGKNRNKLHAFVKANTPEETISEEAEIREDEKIEGGDTSSKKSKKTSSKKSTKTN